MDFTTKSKSADNFPMVLRETIPLGNPHFSGSMREHTCHSHILLSPVSSQEHFRLIQTLRDGGEERKGAGMSLSQPCGNQQVPALIEALETVVEKTVIPPKRGWSHRGHHRT